MQLRSLRTKFPRRSRLRCSCDQIPLEIESERLWVANQSPIAWHISLLLQQDPAHVIICSFRPLYGYFYRFYDSWGHFTILTTDRYAIDLPDSVTKSMYQPVMSFLCCDCGQGHSSCPSSLRRYLQANRSVTATCVSLHRRGDDSPALTDICAHHLVYCIERLRSADTNDIQSHIRIRLCTCTDVWNDGLA